MSEWQQAEQPITTPIEEGQTEQAVVAEPPKPKATRSTPKWEQETRERLRSFVRRFNKPLQDLITRDANEGDTRLLITDFLCDALGYDKYEDLTTEYAVRASLPTTASASTSSSWPSSR